MPISTIGTNSLGSTAQIGSLTTASGSAPSYSARAWVNFNGQGTVAIRASGNVSSITDNGTGNYAVNFTTAMVDANYSTTCGGYGGNPCTVSAQNTSNVNVISFYSGGYYDVAQVTIAIFC